MNSNNAKDLAPEVLSYHEQFMRAAIEEAKMAGAKGEVPIGAVAVLNGEIIGRGHNLREKTNDATAHAEIYAIRMANQHLTNWRLEDVDLYVTLEPCPMCSGAMILSRLRHVYFGAYDPKGGTAGTLMNLLADHRFNHQVSTTGNILESECRELLQSFFRELRIKRKTASRKPNFEKNF